MNRRFLSIYPIILLILLLAAPFVIQSQDGIQFSAAVNKTTTVQYGDLQLTIPAGAAAQPMTVATTGLNLTGIRRPTGFVPTTTVYRFGPDGLKFGPGKSLDFKLKINSALIPKGYSPASVRLFYINRQLGLLEEVKDQNVNLQTGVLEAKLPHFSEYVPGLVPDWAGTGLNPWIDFISKGEESLCLNGLKLSINSTMLSIPGRGMDLKLNRVYSNSYTYNYRNDTFSISPKFYWDMPHYSNGQLCLPGGACYNLSHPIHQAFDYAVYDEGIVFKVYKRVDTAPTAIVLNDGTTIDIHTEYQQVTDASGNHIRYNFTNYNPIPYGEPIYKLTSIIDSTGRQFNLSYEYESYPNNETVLCLTRVEQVIPGNSPKTILTRSMTLSDYPYSYAESFSNSIGVITTYHMNKADQYHPTIESHDVKRIDYYNGVHSEYGYAYDSACNEYRVSTQQFFYPGAGSPYRTVNYSYNYSERSTTVTEPDCNKKLYFTNEGHTGAEYTYDLSGKLQKHISYSYPRINIAQPNEIYDFESSRPTQVTTVYGKQDGTSGSPITFSYQYDDFGNTTRITDPYNITYMAYANTNSEKNLHDQINPLYENARYQSGPSAEIHNLLLTKATIVNDPIHSTNLLKQTHFKYNSSGTLQKESVVYDGLQGRTTLDTCYEYDSYGNPTLKRDANGNELRFEYSSLYSYAYPTRVYLTGGTTLATYEYDPNTGRKTTATDPKGNVFRYSYDVINRLTSEKLDNPDPNVGVERDLIYNDQTNVVKLTFGNGTVQQEGRITFDALFGKPVKIQRKLNGAWTIIKQFTYDTSGRLYTETDGLGHTSTHNYDPLNREILTRLPDGVTTTQAWDDKKLTITDANNVNKEIIYDLLDRLVQVDEHPNSTTTYTTGYTYDSDSHLVRTINNRLAETKNSYDNIGRLIQTDYPAQDANRLTPETFTYDNVGNLLTKTGANGTRNIAYDFICGEYIVKTMNEPGRSISYTYDPNGNLLTQNCPGAVYTYSNFDARNRAHNFLAQIEGNAFYFNYNYDLYGRMTSITYPNRAQAITYSYDDLDRLQSIPGFVTSCNYDEDSKLTDMLFGNGINNHYTYQSNDDKIANISIGPSGSLLNLNYSYDNNGNITQINNDYYSYDGLNRLKWAGDQLTRRTGNGTLWTYDSVGNITSTERYINSVNQGVITSNFDLANRLLSIGGKTYTNDSAGNRTGKIDTDNWAYIYDGENRLTQVNKNGASILQNSYDGSGMRVKKIEGGKTIYFVYNGNDPILEYSAMDAKYTYYIYAGKQTIAEETNGIVKFYHKDHLGSTRVVTDASGSIIASYTYEAFGKVISGGDGEQRFTGKEQDATELYYFGARFYDPEVGRFITADTYTNLPNDERIILGGLDAEQIINNGIYYPQKLNRYLYCRNNPICAIDPDGHKDSFGQYLGFGVIAMGCKMLHSIYSGQMPTPGQIFSTFMAAVINQGLKNVGKAAQEAATKAGRATGAAGNLARASLVGALVWLIGENLQMMVDGYKDPGEVLSFTTFRSIKGIPDGAKIVVMEDGTIWINSEKASDEQREALDQWAQQVQNDAQNKNGGRSSGDQTKTN